MPIRVTCPNCQTAAVCPDEYRGKAVRCKKCSRPFVAGSAPQGKSQPNPGGKSAAPRRAAPVAAPAAPPPKRGHGRLLIAVVAAAVLGAGVGFPAAYFFTKKDHQPDPVVLGPGPTARDDTPRGSPPPATDKQEAPRDTGTKPPDAEAPVVWHDYTSREAHFSARFPGRPDASTGKDLAGNPTRTFQVSVDAKRATFSVACTEFDPPVSADDYLSATAAAGVAKGAKKADLKLAGVPGVELAHEESDREGHAWLTTERYYVVRGRVYQLVAGGPKDRAVAPLFAKFFDSFALLDTSEPEPPVTPVAERPPRDRALAWLEENNGLGPTGNLVDKAKGLFDARVKDGGGFTLVVGSGAVKSKKPTLLASWGGELFVFELSAEQAKALKVGELALLMVGLPPPAGRREAKPPVTLSDLKATAGPKLAGTVAYKRGDAVSGSPVLRLTYAAGPNVRVRRLPLTAEKLADAGSLDFSFPPVSADDPTFTGPLVVFVELCASEGAGKPETVVSNAVAALVNVTPAAPPKLADLRLTAPEGWQADYNKYLGGVGGWLVKKPPPTPRSEGEVLRIEECPTDAATPEAYAKGLKEKDFLLIEMPAWADPGTPEELPDGFVFKGVVKKYDNPKTPPVLGVVAVRDIGGLKVRCFAYNLRSEKSRDEVLEMFKAAKFEPAK